MKEMEELRQWLAGCAPLQGMPVRLEELGKNAPCAALRGEGMRELRRREDITGRAQVRYALSCRLAARFFRSPGDEGSGETNRWLEVQKWVQAHGPPAFGEEQTARLEKGRLAEAAGDGTVVYEAALTVEYTKSEG